LSSAEPSELLIRVNGWHAAWPGDFWQDPGRDVALRGDAYRRANTSVSLIIRRREELLLHVLVDAGMGALNSLLDFQYQTRVNRVDALLLTHPHFDHIAGLDWLANMVRRSNVPEQPKPLPLYCSLPCYEEAIGRRFVWLKDLYRHRPLDSGQTVRIEGRDGAALDVTPLAVWHGPTAPGALIYRIDDQLHQRHIVLAWDLLRLADGVDDGPLRDADLLFIDSTSWHPQTAGDDPAATKNHNTWHGSIEEWLSLIPVWHPKRTYLIHYSGSSDVHPHPDCPDPAWAQIKGPLSESELESQVRRVAEKLKLDLRVARHAMLIPHDEAWP
jgi:ribonuclease BN (tRNA processing enzyme)